MQFKQYNNKNKPVFMYIHGECLSSFSFKQELKELKKDFTVILPILPGHGDDTDTFRSIDQCCEEILSFIDQEYDGHIHVASGFSLGGQIVVSLLAKRPDLCAFAMVESAHMQPVKLRNWSAYASTHANGLAKQKWFNKFMYYTVFNDDYAVDDYYANYQKMTKENLQAVLDASHSYEMAEGVSKATCKMAILVGQREKKSLKHSANLLHDQVANSQIFMLMNYTHGDFSLGNPNEYIRFVKSWVQNKDLQQRKAVKKKKQMQEGEYMPNWKHLMIKMKEKKAKKNLMKG